MNERELLVDCLRRLNRSGITYYLTGSMASNYWGIPRTTHDLDFVVQLSDPAGACILREFSGDFYIDEKAVRAAQQPPYQGRHHQHASRVCFRDNGTPRQSEGVTTLRLRVNFCATLDEFFPLFLHS
jgi:hypothetical protein